jgi:hypothetical protein
MRTFPLLNKFAYLSVKAGAVAHSDRAYSSRPSSVFSELTKLRIMKSNNQNVDMQELQNRISVPAVISFIEKAGLMMLLFFVTVSLSFGQAVGDYRSNGTGLWGTLATWQRWNGGAWQTPTGGQGYPGQNASAAAITIQNGHIVDLNVSPANPLASIDISFGNADSYIVFVGANALTVTGNTNLYSNGNNDWKAIYVNDGSFTSGSVTMNSTNDNRRDAFIEINNGTVNVSGNITMLNNSSRNYIRFTGNGTLFVGGDLSGGGITSTNGGGAAAPTSGTVNYNGTTAQNVGAYTYYNLTFSGGGTKTLQGGTTVDNNLNLLAGVLQLGNNDLTIADGASISGTYSATSMIETNGSGNLVKLGNASADYTMVYPLGTGTYYTPMQVSNSVVSGVGNLTVRAVPLQRDPSYTNSLNKYWSVSATNIVSADLSFTYDPAEVVGNQAAYEIRRHSGGTFFIPPSPSATGANPMSSTGANPLTGDWTAIETTIPAIYYSYQTGNWDVPDTWTSDPGGTTQVGSTIPSDGDIVVILSGRTVTLPFDIATTGLYVTIRNGGILDQSTYQFTGGLTALQGEGTLKLASVNFPLALVNTFVSVGGGTTEYNNAADFTLPVIQTSYNNLTINAPGVIATQMGDLTLNGNLHIEQGTYRINDNASTITKTLTVSGDVTVDNGASIAVGRGSTNGTTNPYGINGGTAPFINYYTQFHTVIVNGNFTNNGTVRFTNLTFPVFDLLPPLGSGATSGAASVFFMGAGNTSLTCNGTTDFYNLILDKGIDQTFELTVYSSAYPNFRLFGANISGGDNPGNNPNLKKALWIRTGTLVLKGLSIIPSLSEGTCGDGATPNSDFYIPVNGALVLDGPDVVVLSTADDYREVNIAYGVSGGTGLINGVGLSGCSSFSILGKVKVNNGYFSTRESGGFITWDWASGQFELAGGSVDAKQFRAAGGTGGLASFTQTGGTLYLRGRFQRTPAAYSTVNDLKDFSTTTLNTTRIANSLDGNAGTFNLNDPANVFNMSGGIMRIYDVCGTGAGQNGAFEVFSSATNINVIGGTIEIIPTTGSGTDATSYLIETTAPVYNLLINRASGTTPVQLNTYALEVLKNLTIQSGDFSANDLDVSIGGNFTIQNGTTYTPGTNRTIFNGTGAQSLAVNLAAPLTLNKLIIDKTATDVLTLAGTQNIINVTDSLRLMNGQLNDGGKTVNFAGNLYNSGVHYGSGKLVANGTLLQNISGDGTGVFENLELNNTNAAAAPVSLLANTRLNGQLTFSQDKIFNINTYGLTLSGSANIINGGTNRYIQTSGNAGDGGLTKIYASPATFNFPVGVVNYTPAALGLSGAPTSYGSITVIPVNYAHPNVTAPGRSLTYFWRVKSSGFILGPAQVTHSYTYDQSNVVTGGGITENEYVAARYNSSAYTWTRGNANDVDETGNIIGEPGTGNFLENVSFIDGEYTAGDDNPTNPFGTPSIYYSRQSGLWSNVNNWSLTGHTVNNPPATPPGVSDIVIIGDNDSIYLATNNTVANTGIQNCASLQIETGSALDIGYNPGCNFSIVLSHPNGNGNFRLTTSWNSGSTYVFPSGDFSDFNINLGTTELYSTNPAAGTTYWLPNNVSAYGNLILSPLGGSNIIFPNLDLLIYGNCITRGQNADSWFCPTWNTNYPTAPVVRVPKTITVNGDLDIQGGALVWYGNAAITQDIVVHGDVLVRPNSAIDVWAAATSQSLSIGGSLINNTTGAAGGGITTPRRCDFTLLPISFFGDSSASVTNTLNNPVTIFDRVTVNKGTSQSTTLTVDIGGTMTTPADNWLAMQNGTLIYERTGNLTITTTSIFSLPATAGLYINTPSNVLIADANSNTNDLYLSGKLTLISGNVYIGPIAAPNNNNDIEYSGGGYSEIDIQGGNLIVNGQIRRNPATTAGVLKFNQSGGQVVINGNNAIASNAKLEILNTGSQFDMSGGTLTIVRGGGGNTYGDLYLRPESSTVTGGEIIFTQVSPFWTYDAIQSYILDATIPLNNLTITGKDFGTNRDATVNLLISPLVLNGTLKLTNSRSYFDANSTYNITVTIKGDLDNSGTYNHYQNHTIFNGGTQSIIGISANTFYDLTVSPVTSLTLNGTVVINNDLTLSNGTLICGANTVAVSGDLINNANYTDTNTGVILNGSEIQYISGSGTFGRLELNNAAGARLNNGITLQKDLALTQGIFDINRYMLVLGQNSNITGAPFGTGKMITSDGVFSNVGIQKYFGIIGSPTTFTYPLGTSGKYTPALLTINTNTNVGYVRLNNINSRHPGVIDPANVLDYFWELESSGITGFNGNLVLNYLDEDVLGVQENNYMAARLIIPGSSWSLTSDVDDIANTITYNYITTDNLSGEYTAGINTAFPPDVPVYTSNADGNWTNNAIWTQTGGTPFALPPGGPNGFIVIVDHEVTMDASYGSAYRLTINGKLDVVAPYFGHNLGTVDGSGTLYLESGTFPAGRFDDFLDCANNSTLEYGGTGTYTLIADLYSQIPNLYFSGSGSRVLPGKDLTICNRLMIGNLTDSPTLDNSVNNKKLTILGTMERYNASSFISGTGAGATVSFSGSSAQTIAGALGDFTAANAFNNFEINNASGLSVNAGGGIEVKRNLLLTDGLITTTSTNTLSITNTAINCVVPAGGSSSSYVDGPLNKIINQSDDFLFPIGKGAYLGNKLTLSATQTGPTLWTAEYFNPNAYTTFAAPLSYVNTKEYWNITTPAGDQAIVNLKWDPFSDLTPLMTQNGLSDMRVSEYDGIDWIELTSTASGDDYNGSVQTTGRVSFPAIGNNVTLACINTTKPKATLTPGGPICGVAGIPVTFSQSPALNYAIDYTIDGVPQTTEIVSSLPYTLPTATAGVYRLTYFTYNSGGNVGVVDINTVTVYDAPTTADAGPNQSLCGATSAVLAGNAPVVGTGLWSIISGSGGSFVTPTSPTSTFNGTNGTTYTLRWTISNGTCTSADDVVISFPLLPLQPGAYVVSSPNVCQNTNGITYAVPNDASVTYTWNYSGTGATINGTGNAVTVDFDATATSGTLSVTATNGCGTSAARNIAITVNAMQTITLTNADINACVGNLSTSLAYTATTGTPDRYSLDFDATAEGQGFADVTNMALPASPITITVPAAPTPGLYNAVLTVNNNTTSCISANYAITITVIPPPAITNPGNQTVCDSYTLPVIAGTNLTGGEAYYTGAGGTGSVLAVGSSVTSTQTIYIYDETGTTPNCSDEVSFMVTVNVSPAPSITGLTDGCEGVAQSFSIAASGNNYLWTVTAGSLDSGQGTDEIQVTWDTLLPVGTLSATGTVEVTETDPSTTCQGTTSINVTVHRMPVTGPAEHIDPNIFQ